MLDPVGSGAVVVPVVGDVRALAGLGYGPEEIRDSCASSRPTSAPALLRERSRCWGRAVRDEFLEPGVEGDHEDAVEVGLRPAG